VRDTGLTAADAWAIADDRSTWRALRPIAGYAQQWVSEWVSSCQHALAITPTSSAINQWLKKEKKITGPSRGKSSFVVYTGSARA